MPGSAPRPQRRRRPCSRCLGDRAATRRGRRRPARGAYQRHDSSPGARWRRGRSLPGRVRLSPPQKPTSDAACSSALSAPRATGACRGIPARRGRPAGRAPIAQQALAKTTQPSPCSVPCPVAPGPLRRPCSRQSARSRRPRARSPGSRPRGTPADRRGRRGRSGAGDRRLDAVERERTQAAAGGRDGTGGRCRSTDAARAA